MDVNLHRSFGQPASGAGQQGKAVTAGEILCEAGTWIVWVRLAFQASLDRRHEIPK